MRPVDDVRQKERIPKQRTAVWQSPFMAECGPLAFGCCSGCTKSVGQTTAAVRKVVVGPQHGARRQGVGRRRSFTSMCTNTLYAKQAVQEGRRGATTTVQVGPPTHFFNLKLRKAASQGVQAKQASCHFKWGMARRDWIVGNAVG